MSISEEFIKHHLSNVAAKFNFKEWKYSVQKFKSIAQNYFGVLIPVVLSGKRNTKEEVNIELVMKLAPTDEKFRVSGAITLMFAREIFIYSIVLKKYAELQENFLPQYQFVKPDCYYVCKDYCNEAIVMQNMCADGYRPFTDKMVLDLDHIVLSLKYLAVFHALSFILREKYKKLYEKAEDVCVPLTENNNKRFMTILDDRLTKALEKFGDSIYVPLLEKLKKYCVTFVEAASKDVEVTCICHGDIWKENIMFKYEEGKPVSACMIDYQATRICSPAFDALYLMTVSTETELRQTHFEDLMDMYYQTFNQTLGQAGLDSQTIYTREQLASDMKVVGPACLIVANTALWLSNGLQEIGHVKSKHIWKTPEEKAVAVNKYKSTIQGIIEDYNNYGFLCMCE